MDFKERWKEGILNALFPPRCILCDEVLEEKVYICSLCREKELFMEEPCCGRRKAFAEIVRAIIFPSPGE